MERDAAIVRTKLALSEMMADPAAADFEDMEELTDQLNQWEGLGVSPSEHAVIFQGVQPRRHMKGGVQSDVRVPSMNELDSETGPALS